MIRRKSTDLSRVDLIRIVARLRGELVDAVILRLAGGPVSCDDPFFEHAQVALNETAFDIEGDDWEEWERGRAESE